MNSILNRFRRAALFLALVPTAHATTWVVDANGGAGVNFRDIPPAIAAAVPGDVILVHAGQYSVFTLNKGVTILGTFGAAPGGTRVGTPSFGSTSVTIPAGETALLADLRFNVPLQLSGCAGPVMLDRIETVDLLSISACTDVRLHRHTAKTTTSITSSHFEIASSNLQGQSGSFVAGYGGDGKTALTVNGASHGLIARSSIAGGHGGSVPIGLPGDGGRGAAAILLSTWTPVPTLLIAGGGVGTVAGGWGGVSYFQLDGDDGDGLYNSLAGDWRSGCSFTCGQTSGNALPIRYVAGPGSFDTAITPDDPTLEFSGTPSAGGSVQLNVHATPGAVVRLAIGGNLMLLPTAGVRVEKSVTQDAVLFLGVVPPNSVISQVVSFRTGYRPGTTFYAQGIMSDPVAGESRRTNSVPLVVR